MDMLILIGVFCILCLLAIPLPTRSACAIIARLDRPALEAVCSDSDGMDVCCCWRSSSSCRRHHAEGCMASRSSISPVFVGFIRCGLALV